MSVALPSAECKASFAADAGDDRAASQDCKYNPGKYAIIMRGFGRGSPGNFCKILSDAY